MGKGMKLRLLPILALLLCSLAGTAVAQAGRGREFKALGEQITAAQRAGNLVLAEDLARQRLAVAENGPDRMVGNAYRNLGNILRLRGKYSAAEGMLKKALPLIESGNGRNSFQAIRTLFNLGLLYTTISRYADAEAVLRDALARQLTLDAEDQDAIQAYNHLANVERLLGRYAEAESLLRKAEAVSGKILVNDMASRDEFSLKRLRLQTAFQYAQLYHQQARYADAERAARQAMAGFAQLEGERHPDFANAQTLLGLCLLNLRRYDAAEPLLRQALQLDEQIYGPEHRETGRAAWGLALTLMRNGKAAEAEPLLKHAIETQRESGASSQQASFERSYARLLVQQQRLPEAWAHYQRALDTIDRIFAQTQGLDEATREGFVAQFAPYYYESLQVLLRLQRLNPAGGFDRQALAVVSRTQSRLFTEMLRKSDAGKLSGDAAFVDLRRRQESSRQKLADLRRARTLVAREETGDEGASGDDVERNGKLALRTSSDPLIAARMLAQHQRLSEEIATEEHQLDKLEAELWQRYPRYMELTQPRPVTVEALQTSLLKSGETLLSYFLLPDRVLIFVVEREKFRLLEVVRSRQEIAGLVSAARRAEENAGAAPNALATLDPQVLFALYETLFKPVEADLKPGRRVLVIGDGPVHTLPLEMLVHRWGEAERRAFAAARAARPGQLSEYATLPYLGQLFHFAYLPSLSALASVRLYRKPAVSYERELVSFADPVFETGAANNDGSTTYSAPTRTALALMARSVQPSVPRASLTIPRLPETADEAREIAAILGGRSTVLLREQAQEHAAKTMDLHSVRYLHFATHGLLGGEFAQLSGLLRAGQPASAEMLCCGEG